MTGFDAEAYYQSLMKKLDAAQPTNMRADQKRAEEAMRKDSDIQLSGHVSGQGDRWIVE